MYQNYITVDSASVPLGEKMPINSAIIWRYSPFQDDPIYFQHSFIVLRTGFSFINSLKNLDLIKLHYCAAYYNKIGYNAIEIKLQRDIR